MEKIVQKDKKRWLTLFITFLKIGTFSFGGGAGMIPLITKEIVEKRKWLKDEDVLDMVALAESTPGPIAINVATFVGYQTCGYFGSFVATLGSVIPSFTIITIIAYLLQQFQSELVVKYAFFGIRAGVLALVLKAFLSLFKACPKGVFAYILMLLAFLIITFTEINAIYVILGSALLGLAAFVITKNYKEDKE